MVTLNVRPLLFSILSILLFSYGHLTGLSAVSFKEEHALDGSYQTTNQTPSPSGGSTKKLPDKPLYRPDSPMHGKDFDRAREIMDEMIKHGDGNDDYLADEKWERIDEDVARGKAYLGTEGSDPWFMGFQEIYCRFSDLRSETGKRRAEIDSLIKKIKKKLEPKLAEFQRLAVGTNIPAAVLKGLGIETGATLLEKAAEAAVEGPVGKVLGKLMGGAAAAYEWYKAITLTQEYADMELLLPEILEMLELVAYLEGLLDGYDDLLEKLGEAMENLEEAHQAMRLSKGNIGFGPLIPCEIDGDNDSTGPELAISLGVPFGHPPIDSVGSFLTGEQDYMNDYSQMKGPCYEPYFDAKPRRAHLSLEFAAYYFPSLSTFSVGPFNIFLGAGVGIGSFHLNDSAAYGMSHASHYEEDFDGNWDFSHEFQVNNTSISPQIAVKFGSLPFHTEVNAYFGVDVNFASMEHMMTQKEDISWYWVALQKSDKTRIPKANGVPTGYWKNDYKRTENLKDTALGLRWGIGGRLNLVKQLAVGVELYGRHVKFDSWSGIRTDTGEQDSNGVTDSVADSFEGMLYSYKGKDLSGNIFHGLEVFEEDPGGNAQLAVINGNRWGVRLNLIVNMRSLFKTLVSKSKPARKPGRILPVEGIPEIGRPEEPQPEVEEKRPESSQTGELKLRVIVQKANIRLWPDARSEIVLQVPLGAVLVSDVKEGVWYRVLLPPDDKGIKRSGYIHSNIVEVIVRR